MAQKITGGCAGCIGALFIGLVVLAVVGSSTHSCGDSPKTEGELRKKRIGNNFSAWDGSLPGLTELIKASMNDPDSYDHVETVYWDCTDHLVVRTTFRGKNAFGGVVKNWVKAKVDLDGNVLEITEQGP